MLLNLTHKSYLIWPTNVIQIDPQTLLKLTHKRYSKSVKNDPQTLLKLTHKRSSKSIRIDPQTLLKIGVTNITQN